MICSLCLGKINDNDETVTIDGKIRHKSCSDEFEALVEELRKISEEDGDVEYL